MTEFKKVTAALDEADDIKGRLGGALDGAPTEDMKAAYKSLKAILEGVMPTIVKMKRRCAEPDPELQTYGPKMKEKVLGAIDRYEGIETVFEENLKPVFEEVVETEARRLAEKDQQTRDAEEAEWQESERARKKAFLERDQQRQAEAEAARVAEVAEANQQAQREADEKQAELDAMKREQEELAKLEGLSLDERIQVGVRNMWTSLRVGEIRELVDALGGLVGGVASCPDDIRRRAIRLKNHSFQAGIGSKPGAIVVLLGCGFDHAGRDKIPAPVLADMQELGSRERFLWMAEPDLNTHYEEWVEWQDRLMRLSSTFDKVSKYLTRKGAPLGQRGAELPATSMGDVEDIVKVVAQALQAEAE
mmetsp:Transcript_34531/g.75593  ORF Transcript_34531/g.75593 Transcript_34531/m.75593 type:complete len:362 (-) Transcript_34531:224-1309(-)